MSFQVWLRFLNERPGSWCSIGGGNDRSDAVDTELQWLLDNWSDIEKHKYETVILPESVGAPLPTGKADW